LIVRLLDHLGAQRETISRQRFDPVELPSSLALPAN
jgi:hypothetical protein